MDFLTTDAEGLQIWATSEASASIVKNGLRCEFNQSFWVITHPVRL